MSRGAAGRLRLDETTSRRSPPPRVATVSPQPQPQQQCACSNLPPFQGFRMFTTYHIFICAADTLRRDSVIVVTPNNRITSSFVHLVLPRESPRDTRLSLSASPRRYVRCSSTRRMPALSGYILLSRIVAKVTNFIERKRYFCRGIKQGKRVKRGVYTAPVMHAVCGKYGFTGPILWIFYRKRGNG